jgi:dihydrofolate reductase
MSGAPAEIGSRLAARGVRHIYVDGGITIQRFLQAGLIQRLIITRIPVLLRSGIPHRGRRPGPGAQHEQQAADELGISGQKGREQRERHTMGTQEVAELEHPGVAENIDRRSAANCMRL